MSKHAKATRPVPASQPHPPSAPVPSGPALPPYWPVAVAVLLAAVFVGIALPVLGTLPYDFDEGYLMLDARFIAAGQRPFVDFAHHEMPLDLYLLALAGKLFGQTVLGYRLLSLLSIAGSGLLLFALTRSVLGPLPALAAEAAFLFSPLHGRALTAVPETPTVLFTLLALVLLFTRTERWSAWASGVAFVVALTIKPTGIVVVAAAVASLAWAREWRRLADLALSGTLAAVVALAWANYVSDGVFAEMFTVQLARMGTRSAGMWSVDSGFTDLRHRLRIDNPRQWAFLTFRDFYLTGVEPMPMALFVCALLAIPVWIARCVRTRPAWQAFTLLWPASNMLLNGLLLDFVSPRYFIPFHAFESFLLAGWFWLLLQYAPQRTSAIATGVFGAALAVHLFLMLGRDRDPWYWSRLADIASKVPQVVSFSPMVFAATGMEPGCGLSNPVITYGGYGEALLSSERTRGQRWNDERVIACLEQNPQLPVIVDWAFYFFTRPGSPLRTYLAGDGIAHRAFFSQGAIDQWDRPLLQMDPFR